MAKLILVLDVSESAEKIMNDLANNSGTAFKVRSAKGRRSPASIDEGTVVAYTFKGPSPMAVEQAYVSEEGLGETLGRHRLF